MTGRDAIRGELARQVADANQRADRAEARVRAMEDECAALRALVVEVRRERLRERSWLSVVDT